MEKRTLEEIIKREQKMRHEDGIFGINECKKAIKFDQEVLHKSLFQQLEDFYKRANEDIFFNRAMILACWELINEQE